MKQYLAELEIIAVYIEWSNDDKKFHPLLSTQLQT